jgi:hypothetical protein
MNLVEDFDLLQSTGHAYDAYERPASADAVELPSTSGAGMLSLEATIRKASRSVRYDVRSTREAAGVGATAQMARSRGGPSGAELPRVI